MAKQQDIPVDASKVTLMMSDAMVNEFDRLAVDHREKTRAPMSRSYFVYRALATVDIGKLAKQLQAEALSGGGK